MEAKDAVNLGMTPTTIEGRDIPSGVKRFVEANRKEMVRISERGETVTEIREHFKRRHKLDITDEKAFPINDRNFSYREAAKKLAANDKFREADTTTLLPQLLRAGVQQLALRGYQTMETSFERWVTTVPSKLKEELYAPSHGPAFPREVGERVKYPTVGIAALDLKLPNRKYGSIYEVSKELVKYDQTGQIIEGSTLLGQYLKILQEVLCYAKLASVANMVYAQFTPPASETKPSYETAYPWAPSATPLKGGGVTRPTSFGVLTSLNIQAGITALRRQKNLQGLIMPIVVDQLIVGSNNEFNAKLIANSAFYPQNVSGVADKGTGAFGINVLQGAFDIVMTQFMFKNDGTCLGDSLAWYLTSSKAGGKFVMQIAEAVAVEQEAINSGTSFEEDTYRYKGSMMGNADFVDPRWFWQGNDGSVTS